ncbi:hypothetical protein QOZ80_1BG0096590 [Eleusine coracana subsp. coracana]|nr:hypothetical protein QOZ80_1BG0096590 [Eleusine coracana subsp. coracana]
MSKRKHAVNDLTDDLLIEILWRLPERPLCRFKCVSRSWRDLISDPVHRRRLALTDAASGFFYHVDTNGICPMVTHLGFTALCPPDDKPPPPLVVDDPVFPFLPSSYARTRMELLDSCSGLLLLRCHRDLDFDQVVDPFYIVCNPATQDWNELPLPPPLPERSPGIRSGRLLALPRVELVRTDEYEINSGIKVVHIYSSETREWVTRNSEWFGYKIVSSGRHAYLNGFLHFTTADAENGLVASVDTKGQKWKVTRVCPEFPAKLGGNAVIGQSQRRLLFVDADCSGYAPELSIYALESHAGGTERWILKQRVKSLDQSGKMWFRKQHTVVGIHPDCGVIFLFDSRCRKLIAYDMDRTTARIISTFEEASSKYHFFPYIPLHA